MEKTFGREEQGQHRIAHDYCEERDCSDGPKEQVEREIPVVWAFIMIAIAYFVFERLGLEVEA